MKTSILATLLMTTFLSTQSFASYNNKETGFYLKHFANPSDLKDTSCKQFLKTVYRGGQPIFDGSDTWIKRLKATKVKRVFDLREETGNALKERDQLLANGISYYKLPLRTQGNTQLPEMTIEEAIAAEVKGGAPTINKIKMSSVSATKYILEKMEEVISKQSTDETIYLHCQRGEDRTGLMVALLRHCAGTGYKQEFLSYGGVMYKPLQSLMDEVNKNR